jgi:nucleoid-associated protein YgaU
MKSSYKIALMISALICLLVIGYYAAQKDIGEPATRPLSATDPGSTTGLPPATLSTGPLPGDSGNAGPATPTPSETTAAAPEANMDDLMARVRQAMGPQESSGATTPGDSSPGGASSAPAAPPSNTPTLTIDGQASPSPVASATPGSTAPPSSAPGSLTGPTPEASPLAAAPAAVDGPTATGSVAPSNTLTTVPPTPAAGSMPEPTPAATTTFTTPAATTTRTTTPAAASGPATYTIKPGDTLSAIAIRLYNDERRWVDIAQANPTVDPIRLRVGQVLRLPGASGSAASPAPSATRATTAANGAAGSTYTVRSGDTLSSIAQKTLGDRSKWRAIYNLNRAAIGPNENNIDEGMVLKIPPK